MKKYLLFLITGCIIYLAGAYSSPERRIPTFHKEMQWVNIGKNTHQSEFFIDVKNTTHGNTWSRFTVLIVGKESTTITDLRVSCLKRTAQLGPTVITKFGGEQIISDQRGDPFDVDSTTSKSLVGILFKATCSPSGVTSQRLNV